MAHEKVPPILQSVKEDQKQLTMTGKFFDQLGVKQEGKIQVQSSTNKNISSAVGGRRNVKKNHGNNCKLINIKKKGGGGQQSNRASRNLTQRLSISSSQQHNGSIFNQQVQARGKVSTTVQQQQQQIEHVPCKIIQLDYNSVFDQNANSYNVSNIFGFQKHNIRRALPQNMIGYQQAGGIYQNSYDIPANQNNHLHFNPSTRYSSLPPTSINTVNLNSSFGSHEITSSAVSTATHKSQQKNKTNAIYYSSAIVPPETQLFQQQEVKRYSLNLSVPPLSINRRSMMMGGSSNLQQQQIAKRAGVNVGSNGLSGSRRAFPFKQAGACIVLKNTSCNPNLNQNFKSIAAPLQPQSAPVAPPPAINMSSQQHSFGYPETGVNCGGSHNSLLHIGVESQQQQQQEICSMSAQ